MVMYGVYSKMTKPRWPIALGLAACTLASYLCKAFTFPGLPTTPNLLAWEAPKASCTEASCGHINGRRAIPVRRTAITTDARAAHMDVGDEEATLAKFQRLQVPGAAGMAFPLIISCVRFPSF